MLPPPPPDDGFIVKLKAWNSKHASVTVQNNCSLNVMVYMPEGTSCRCLFLPSSVSTPQTHLSLSPPSPSFPLLLHYTCVFFFAKGSLLALSSRSLLTDLKNCTDGHLVDEPQREGETCWKSTHFWSLFMLIVSAPRRCCDFITTCAETWERREGGGRCPFVDLFNLLVIPSWVGQRGLFSDGSSQ